MRSLLMPLDLYHPEAHVVGIAIVAQKKGDPDLAVLKVNEFFCIKYSKESVKTKYTYGYDYTLHCKVFNPGHPFIHLSALMFAGETIGIETHLSSVESLDTHLMYPGLMNEDERLKFHKDHLKQVIGTFPNQPDKKYFYYQKFEFDGHYPFFYQTEEPISILLRVGVSSVLGPKAEIKLLPEQKFVWNHG